MGNIAMWFGICLGCFILRSVFGKSYLYGITQAKAELDKFKINDAKTTHNIAKFYYFLSMISGFAFFGTLIYSIYIAVNYIGKNYGW